MDETTNARRRVIAGGIFLGIGLGGFFDGIVFHQVLQWHHMLSAVAPPTTLAAQEPNTLADGLFHLGTLVLTLLGVLLLWNGSRTAHGDWSRLPLLGLMLIGWGVFNVVEGVVNHHLLGIHRVNPGSDQLWWDLAFLVWGALMLVAGVAIALGRRSVSP